MKQPIAGVTPPATKEVTVMAVFPSIGAKGPGQLIGQLCMVKLGFGFFSLGKLFALACIPLAIGGYAALRMPFVMRRYRLTNRRVVVLKGWKGKDERWVDLDRFDNIDIVVRPGQAWYPAGDMIFRNGPVETFRLEGVQRPEPFRRTCLKAHLGYIGVKKAQGRP